MKSLVILVPLSLQPAFASSQKIQKSCYIQPCEIKGDFDGDKKLDSAILVVDEEGRRGIKVSFASKKTAVLGAGEPIGNGGENFDWMDAWKLHKGKIEQGTTETKRPPTPGSDSLLLQKTASASGLVYWDGSSFQWYQQGD